MRFPVRIAFILMGSVQSKYMHPFHFLNARQRLLAPYEWLKRFFAISTQKKKVIPVRGLNSVVITVGK